MANRGHSCVERTSHTVFSELSERTLELIFPFSRPMDSHIFSSVQFSSTIVIDVCKSLLQNAHKDPFTRRKICTLWFRFEGFSHLSVEVNIFKKLVFPLKMIVHNYKKIHKSKLVF